MKDHFTLRTSIK